MITVVPIGLALLLAALPVVVVPVALTAKSAPATARAFPIGWFAGLCAAAGALVLLADAVTVPNGDGLWSGVLRIALGLLLVVLGLRRWFTRAQYADQAHAWLTGIAQLRAGRAFALAFLLAAVNPKNLVVVVVAAAEIAGAALLHEQVAKLLLFALIGSCGVAAPVVAVAMLGQRAAPALAAVDAWLTRHVSALVAIVLVVLGLYVGLGGARGLD
ncbi:MAG: GAP family protein [Pseudonocardia sp.]